VRRLWLFVPGVCIFFLGRDAAAQTHRTKKAPPCADSLTTRKGVFSAEQAQRGRDVYLGNCRSCHTPETHTGATFNATWNGRPLAQLYSFIRERMPKNDPGTLSDEEYADVLAYLLALNRMPAGRSELAPDSTAMKTVRIALGNVRITKVSECRQSRK